MDGDHGAMGGSDDHTNMNSGGSMPDDADHATMRRHMRKRHSAQAGEHRGDRAADNSADELNRQELQQLQGSSQPPARSGGSAMPPSEPRSR
jgi:hypothetical protein